MNEEDIRSQEAVIELQSVVDELLKDKEAVRVLEAGCGSSSYVIMRQDSYVVGIDISEKQLQRNPGLAERILADVQTYNLPASDFDVIICWNVLEHLSEPEAAFGNFVNSIKEDGIIILALPNVLSLKGLTTKYTPHWFHIWVYRSIFGERLAGREDHGPFPVFMRLSISPHRLKKLATENGLSVKYFRMYESLWQKRLREQYRIIDLMFKLFGPVIKGLSMGQIDPDLTDYILVLKR